MNFDLQAWVVRLALKTTCGHYKNLVPDADLEIRGARSSRPLDKRGGGGDGGLHKFYFGSSGLSLVEKYGGLGPPGPPPPSPGSATGISLSLKHQFYRQLFNQYTVN